MNVKKHFFLLVLCLVTSILQSQNNSQEDVVLLKDGKEYRGLIIEQVPGSSIKFISYPENDTLVFYLAMIEKIKKEMPKQNAVSNPVPTQVYQTSTVQSAQEATYQTGNDLTIFSDDEFKFIIYINGKPTNNTFFTRSTIENINHNWVRVSVVFEDPSKGVIEQDLMLSPNSGDMLPYTSTYQVVNKKGRLKLKYYNQSVKKVAPGAANVVIYRSTTPNYNSNVQFQNSNVRVGAGFQTR